ncbi:hypothetical protein C8R43DRAFT_1130771 [Mycena crocata]|nr:hypothetical protein C8R43DRAFT_1130771 [Mycena crocata]
MASPISAFELLSTNASGTAVPISAAFGLENVKIDIVRADPGKELTITIPTGAKFLAVIVQGDGSYGIQSAELPLWDCLGWRPASDERSFTVVAGPQGITILSFSRAAPKSSASPTETSVPQILNGYSDAKPSGSGPKYCSFVSVTRTMGLTPSADPTPWNVNFEILPPGTKSSDAHAHSHEDEFAFILKGKARYWNHGVDVALQSGDCVGWKAGTGLAHTILNDGEGPNGEGEDLVYVIFGEDYPKDDKCFYPDLPDNAWIHGRPEISWGSAAKEPKFPRVTK